MGFLGHDFGSKHAKRSIKGSIDAADRLVSTKSLSQKSLIGLAPRARQSCSKIQKHALFVASPRQKPTLKSNNFFSSKLEDLQNL